MACAIAVLAISASAEADVLTFDLSIEFSGAFPPEDSPPWLTATFDDGGSAGSVDLTLQTTNLTDAEFVHEWTFNLDPSLDPTDLVFSAPVKTGAFDDPTISTAVDNFKADGDGYFDIELAFSQQNGSSAHRFGVGDGVQYTITGISTLTVHSFNFGSAPGGGAGEYPTAAHVGGIGVDDEDSGWIATPEPAAIVLLSMAGVGLLFAGWRKQER
jgi:hypothetical protein